MNIYLGVSQGSFYIRMSEKAPEREGDTSGDITSGVEQLKIPHTDDDDDGTKDLGLFATPPPREDCPICFLPLPLLTGDWVYNPCCGKVICAGCICENIRVIKVTNAENASRNRNQGRSPLKHICAFCRAPDSDGDEIVAQLGKRMELNDPSAFFFTASSYENGECGLKKDERKAFELYLRAAELGYAPACNEVANCYYSGRGVEKDEKKERMYVEKGAKAGSVMSRHNLGRMEYRNGNIDLATKHLLMSAAEGYQLSLDAVKMLYSEGNAAKNDYAEALRSCHAAQKAEWSKERDNWAQCKKAKDSFHDSKNVEWSKERERWTTKTAKS